LRCTQTAGQALIEVEDSGPGLTDAELEHVFERFWRASELPGGCGLGLAIVAEISHRHNGSATAVRVDPHGLRIAIALPLANPAGSLF
jgi:two-component system, OmpR family, sensor histidine kinase TctE